VGRFGAGLFPALIVLALELAKPLFELVPALCELSFVLLEELSEAFGFLVGSLPLLLNILLESAQLFARLLQLAFERPEQGGILPAQPLPQGWEGQRLWMAWQ
jgi:hypothetical protein